MTPDNVGLGGIGDPARCRYEQVTVIDQLQEEHQFFRTGPDQDVAGMKIEALSALVIIDYRLLQLRQPPHRQVVLLVGIGLQLLDNGKGDGEGRLP